MRKITHDSATQTDTLHIDWDPHAVDRQLDFESGEEDDVPLHLQPPPPHDTVFVRKDDGHLKRLVDIVRTYDGKEGGKKGQEGEEEQTRAVVPCDGEAASFSSTLTSTVPDASACSDASTWGTFTKSSLMTAEAEERSPPCVVRRVLMPSAAPSPIKVTFVPPRVARGQAQKGEEDERERDAGKKVAERRRTSVVSPGSGEGNDVTLGGVMSVVDKVDPRMALGLASPVGMAAMGILRRKKRASDESVRSSETEYYEDEYTRFIQKKSNSSSPLRLSLVGFGRARLDSRTNSTLSVPTSDDEYQGEVV